MNQFANTLVRGENILSFGLESKGVMDPLSLLTFGFVSDCQSIWLGQTLSLATSWAGLTTTISTTWVGLTTTLVTTWVGVSGVSYGEC